MGSSLLPFKVHIPFWKFLSNKENAKQYPMLSAVNAIIHF